MNVAFAANAFGEYTPVETVEALRTEFDGDNVWVRLLDGGSDASSMGWRVVNTRNERDSPGFGHGSL